MSISKNINKIKIYYILSLALVLICLTTYSSKSQIYTGIGVSYNNPIKDIEAINEPVIGYRLEVLNKEYCNLWYGIKFDYFQLKQKDQQYPYLENNLLVQPELKYAPFVNDCYDNKIIPYVQANLTFSSISSKDELSKLGFGYGGGVGFAYNFKMFDKCLMLDLDALYSLPNNIYKTQFRNKIETINVGLTLSVNL